LCEGGGNKVHQQENSRNDREITPGGKGDGMNEPPIGEGCEFSTQMLPSFRKCRKKDNTSRKKVRDVLSWGDIPRQKSRGNATSPPRRSVLTRGGRGKKGGEREVRKKGVGP